MRLCVAAVLLLFGAAAADATAGLVQFTDADPARAGWQVHARRDGVLLERRRVPGSSYYEHRAVMELPVAPEAAADEVWRSLRDGDMATLKRRQIVAEAPNELVLYDQIHIPVINDRD